MSTGSVDFRSDIKAAALCSLEDAEGAVAAPTVPVIDASVQVRPTTDELRGYLPEVWRERRLPPGERYYYPNPVGDYVRESYGANGIPGSDPELVTRHLFETLGVSRAVLLPRTLGLLPDVTLLSAICSATNDWLADRWLSRDDPSHRFLGTIRIAPGDAEGAVAEIDRWADHPGFVQIGIPLQSLALYGAPQFRSIWESAAAHGLPVALLADKETGVELAPTTAGWFRHFTAFAAYEPMTIMNHMTSFMVNGVLDELSDLRLVFADGGYDLCAPLIWRLDKDYRPMRADMPWMKRPPSAYIAEQIRFIARRLEGPEDDATLAEWLEMAGAEHTLVYGSSYPSWDLLRPDAAFATVDAAVRGRILNGNAAGLYGLGQEGETT